MVQNFAQTRAELSSELTGLNDLSVREITEGLRGVIAIRDRTEGTIADSTTEANGQCITDAIANWPSDLETVGDEIAACADRHVDPIYEATENLHIYIQEQNRVAFDAQNMVLNIFTDVR
jgi:hypothetical protein